MEKENVTLLTTKLLIKPDCTVDFANWQAKLNVAIANQPGFISLEILSPLQPQQREWLVVQRFFSSEDTQRWHRSEVRKKLMEDVNEYLVDDSKDHIKETFSNASGIQGGVTEVFVTQVNPENEKAYREWIAKIHEAEAKFPGFRGVYMQSPSRVGGLNWITLLQFDTPENLDHWLNSPERQKVLKEAKSLITSLESHRMISPYAGWFASLTKTGEMPPVWKQTMIILLVLFPIVMFELKYLLQLTAGLNVSLGTFIGNAISVTLISWPMMPIAIFFLGWWLVPKSEKHFQATFLGTFVILLLYIAEIAIFWHFL